MDKLEQVLLQIDQQIIDTRDSVRVWEGQDHSLDVRHRAKIRAITDRLWTIHKRIESTVRANKNK